MEKLEPVIRHKFWILFGISLPMICFAYYSAAGKMAEATTAQEGKLDSTLSGVPSGDAEPNDTYAAGAKKINEDLTARFDVQVQKLWELQTERMSWPKVIVPFVPDEYHGTIDRKACYTYMRVYPSVLQRLWERVQPYVGDVKTNPAAREIVVEWPQKVLIDGHAIPRASFNMSLPADSEDIWDAQEDIWLLELIFDAVVRTNEAASFISESPVRQIDKIMLVGGSGESSVTASASGGGGGGDYGGEDYGAASDGFSAAPGGLSGMSAQLGAPAQVAFNVAEEFGPQVPEESADGGAAAFGGDSGEEDYGAAGMPGGFGVSGSAKMKRYIGTDDPFARPYRERGFYMSVIILQDRIPDFFAELSSSPWPIRIGRFHMGPNPYAVQSPGSGGGYGGEMAFGTGAGGFGGAEDTEGNFGGFGGGGFGGGGFGGGAFGSGGFGGAGSAANSVKLPAYMKMPASIDPALRAHPDLVQVDFCGIITLYNPVTDSSVDIVDDGSTDADFAEALEESPETPEEAAAMAAEEAANEAANPAPPTPAGEAPATDTPASDAPAADAPASDSAPPPAADPANPTETGAAAGTEAPAEAEAAQQ